GQIPLLRAVPRHDGPLALRVPQSGWTVEPKPGTPAGEAPGSATYRHPRKHRQVREGVSARENRLAHPLFSTSEADVGLHGKPGARTAQIWTEDFARWLTGPGAARADLRRAGEAFRAGGTFGYRFQSPAMRVGRYELYWHRPLVAYRTAGGRVSLLADVAP